MSDLPVRDKLAYILLYLALRLLPVGHRAALPIIKAAYAIDRTPDQQSEVPK